MIGVFGGTFDPVHTGHLILAERAREELNLDRIVFMPAHQPPHKAQGQKIASGSDRIAMLRRAIESNPAFEVTDIELERRGISYTVDSLQALKDEYASNRLTLLMGSDNARDFSMWKGPEKILELADIAVWERPGSYSWPEIYPGYIATRISSPLIEISSTDIRRRVSAGQTIRYLVPKAVLEYILEHGIYA